MACRKPPPSTPISGATRSLAKPTQPGSKPCCSASCAKPLCCANAFCRMWIVLWKSSLPSNRPLAAPSVPAIQKNRSGGANCQVGPKVGLNAIAQGHGRYRSSLHHLPLLKPCAIDPWSPLHAPSATLQSLGPAHIHAPRHRQPTIAALGRRYAHQDLV